VTKYTADLGPEKSSRAICEWASKRARQDNLPSRIALGGGKPGRGVVSKCQQIALMSGARLGHGQFAKRRRPSLGPQAGSPLGVYHAQFQPNFNRSFKMGVMNSHGLSMQG